MSKKKPAKKPAKKTATKSTPAGTSAGASTSFAFANPKPSADNFDTFNPKDIFADTNVKASGKLQPFPAPWKQPSELDLSDVLSSPDLQQITAAGSITIHCVGDTGGIKEPSKQFAVADA